MQEIKDEILGQFKPFLDRYQAGVTPVHLPPEQLRTAVDFTLGETGTGLESLQEILADAARYTPDVSSPTYLGYFYSAPDPVGLLGDWLISLLNTNVHAYEASPFFSLAETEVVRALSRVIGYGKGSDGIFCPGGSYSNMLAMHMARARFLDANKDAAQTSLVCFVSEAAHYSFDRAAALLGFRPDAVVKVKTDPKGRMMAEDLKQKIQKAIDDKKFPFMVCATLGTTVLGAFDPLPEIQAVLADHKDVWLHGDAAWGGAVMMAEAFRPIAKGIEGTDSVTWDFHKAIGAPVLCSVLLQKRRASFSDTVAADMSYLFHGSDGVQEETFNLGEKTPQCGRRADAFKFWLMWKVRGQAYFSRQVEKRFHLAKTFVDLLKGDPCFLVLDETPDYWNIGFWYLPEGLRHLSAMAEATGEQKALLSDLTVAINRDLIRDGSLVINYASLPEQPSFLRMVINNSRMEEADLSKAIERIRSLGDARSAS